MFKEFLIFLIKIYRFFSPLFGRRCRFYPSCSQYAEKSIVKYGVLMGIFLSLKRLLKCHPFHPGGYDPVP